jgi:hypothetical protein
VEHVYLPDGAEKCAGCGADAHDPGMVMLIMLTSEEEEGGDGDVSGLLTVSEALTLANRLQRAASLILESGEGAADVEREAARFGTDGAGQHHVCWWGDRTGHD